MFRYQELLAVFPLCREEGLKKIKRYDDWEVLFYRSSVWTHALRVAVMVKYLSHAAKDIVFGVEWKKAFALAIVHDDAEMITGDVTASKKDHMDHEQLESLKRQELAAIDALAQEYPKKFMGYSYRDLLLHAAHKDCFEALVVSYLDKLDAYCELVHEVFAGNFLGVRGIVAYVERLMNFKNKSDNLKLLFERCTSPLLHINLRKHHSRVSWDDYHHLGQPHTGESVAMETEYLFYNTWKKLVIEELGPEGINWLTTQVEWLPTRKVLPRKLAVVA